MPFALQRLVAVSALLLGGPFIALLALAVKVDSRGPAVYRAERLGRGGRPFKCLKLRTMHWQATGIGPGVTVARDRRVTRVGRFLRRSRVDELPQLWNVARGEMALVGPRPEDPRYVDLDDPLHRRVFTAMPGITGLAQLMFVNEADLLDPVDPERTYREIVLPEKLKLDAAYLAQRSFGLDVWILVQTLAAAVGRPPTAEAIRARL